MKRVIFICGSHRNRGNTNLLMEAVAEPFKRELFSVRRIDLREIDINYYDYKREYTRDDRFEDILSLVKNADLVFLVTPVYWYGLSSRMKTFIDRLSDVLNEGRKEILHEKKIALLYTMGGTEYPKEMLLQIEKICDYLGMKFVGSLGFQGSSSSVGIIEPGWRGEAERFALKVIDLLSDKYKNKDKI